MWKPAGPLQSFFFTLHGANGHFAGERSVSRADHVLCVCVCVRVCVCVVDLDRVWWKWWWGDASHMLCVALYVCAHVAKEAIRWWRWFWERGRERERERERTRQNKKSFLISTIHNQANKLPNTNKQWNFQKVSFFSLNMSAFARESVWGNRSLPLLVFFWKGWLNHQKIEIGLKLYAFATLKICVCTIFSCFLHCNCFLFS